MVVGRRCAVLLVVAAIAACAEYSDAPPADLKVAKCGDPGAPVCGAHGKCVDTQGSARCACDSGYQGDTCGACAAGLQDNDKDGVCLPACDGVKCGPHERCGDAKGAAACACAPGYQRESAGCVFRGGPQDPTFQRTPDAWVATNAIVNPAQSANGNGQPLVDPGAALVSGVDACAGKARLAQSFEMPAFAEAEPLALRWTADLQSCSDFLCRAPFVARSRGAFLRDVVVTSQFFGPADHKACIGERWLGKTIDLTVDSTTGCSSTPVNVVFDHFGIEPDPTCPAVGVIPNANFDDTGGWTSYADANTVAEVANGVGTGQTRGGHLSSSKLCQSPQLRGVMSPRESSAEKLALAFTYRGTNGQKMNIGVDAGTLGVVRGTNVFEKASLCLPDSMKGEVSSLYMSLPYKNPASGGSCDAADVRDFVFDDFALVADPKCADKVTVPDGGFEDASVATSWLSSDSNNASSTRTTAAHTGKSAAYLTGSYACGSASTTTIGTVPASAGGAGPALKFWVRGHVTTPATFSVSYGSGVPVTDAWTQRTVCISPKESGRTRSISFSIYTGSVATCGTFTGAVTDVAIDDVELTTDASCPADAQ